MDDCVVYIFLDHCVIHSSKNPQGILMRKQGVVSPRLEKKMIYACGILDLDNSDVTDGCFGQVVEFA